MAQFDVKMIVDIPGFDEDAIRAVAAEDYGADDPNVKTDPISIVLGWVLLDMFNRAGMKYDSRFCPEATAITVTRREDDEMEVQ